MELEVWRDIPNYNGFQVSNYGNVRSLDRKVRHKNYFVFVKGKILKPSIHKGYKRVSILSKTQIRKWYSIHRLVAEVFIPNPNNYPQVNHINGIKTDNRVENLEWVTASQNIKHAIKNNLKTFKKGNEHKLSKRVLQYNIKDEVIKIWGGLREVERKTGIKATNISNCCKRKRKTAGGYKWEYEKENLI